MEQESGIVSKLIKRKKPDLPSDFFEDFNANLCRKISADEVDLSIPKTTKPTVPSEFFKNFHNALVAEMEATDSFEKYKLQRSQQPVVPQNFDTSFRQELMQKIHQSQRRKKIIRITIWSTGAAAGLALLFTFQTTNAVQKNQPVAETVLIQPDEEALDTYVAYLDEDEVVDYILENDIDLEQEELTNDDVYDYVASDIEDIYLDL